MAIFEYNGHRFEGPDDATPDELDEVGAQLDAQGPAPAAEPVGESTTSSTTTTATSAPGVLDALGEALTERVAKPVANAASTILAADVPMTERLGDAATLASPLLAPELTALGVGVHAGARALGYDRETADTAGDVAEIGAGVAQIGRAGVKAVRGYLGRGQAATDAARATLTKGSTPEAAGAGLQRALPKAATGVREVVQKGPYAKVATFAEARGLGLAPGSAESGTLATALENAEAKWGPLLSGAEKRQVSGLLEKLRGGSEQIATGVLDAGGKAVTRSAPAAKVSYAELDAAEMALQKVRGSSSVRAAISDAKAALVKGTPVESAHRAAGTAWKMAVVPAQRLAAKVAKADTPSKAFQLAVGGKVLDPEPLRIARGMLGADSAEWSRVQGGLYEHLFRRADDNGAKVAKLWAKLPPETRAIVDATGDADKMIANLATLALPKLRTDFAKLGGAIGATARLMHGDLLGALKYAVIESLTAGAVQNFPQLVRVTGVAAKGGLSTPGGRKLVADTLAQLSSGPAESATGSPAADDAAVTDQPLSEMSPIDDTTANAPAGDDSELGAVASVVGLDPAFLRAVIARESGGDQNAVSEKGAIGIMQVLPETFGRLAPLIEPLLGRTPNIYNRLDNLVAGAVLYKQHLDETNGDVEQAARLYHAGPNLELHGPRTKAYGRAVSLTYAKLASL